MIDMVENNKSILEIAKTRFKIAEEAEIEMRKEALEDLKFRAGEQWPDEVKHQRNIDRRPCLTVNRIPQFIRQVTNDQRQNRPAIKVSPVDDQADVETAKVYQGIIRHIEYNSNADIAYDTAFESAATHGFGYFRVITDYCNEDSFEQDIKIKRIRNPFTVYLDPNSQEPDASDAEWGFIFEDMSQEDYKSQYGSSELASMREWRGLGDKAPGWIQDNGVRIAEYFYKEYKETEIVLIEDKNGFRETVELAKMEKNPELFVDMEIIDKRKTRMFKIHWCKINAIEVLEKTEWLGKYIPIIPVYGDEIDLDGRRIFEGVVRHAKDPQRMYNYWASSETETIALAPKAPFIGAEGQFEGHEEAWRTANVRNHAFLEYKPKSLNGQPMGPPQRNNFEPPIAAITNARMQSSEDLKATTGIYDAALGARSNESSGIAIQRRNFQAQTSNFHYIDNMSRALRHLGRILIDLIPKVYDTARSVRVIGEDDEQKIVLINQIFQEGNQQKKIDLQHGKYDVTISSGPSYASMREEALDSMLALTQKYPKVAEVAGDLMIKNMNWPGAEEIAERIKKTIPPEFLADEADKVIPAPVKAQMEQMGTLIDQLTAQLNEKTEMIEQETKKYEHEKYKAQLDFNAKLAKIEGDMRIAQLKQQAMTAQQFNTEAGEVEASQNQYSNALERFIKEEGQEPMEGFDPMDNELAGGEEAAGEMEE